MYPCIMNVPIYRVGDGINMQVIRGRNKCDSPITPKGDHLLANSNVIIGILHRRLGSQEDDMLHVSRQVAVDESKQGAWQVPCGRKGAHWEGRGIEQHSQLGA